MITGFFTPLYVSRWSLPFAVAAAVFGGRPRLLRWGDSLGGDVMSIMIVESLPDFCFFVGWREGVTTASLYVFAGRTGVVGGSPDLLARSGEPGTVTSDGIEFLELLVLQL